MVLYKGYCRPLGKKVNFTVKDVISMNTKRGIKWRVKGTYEDYNISTFCSKVVAEDLLNKLPLARDAEIAYTPPSSTYESEELKPLFSNATKKADEIEAEEETIEVQEQIQENTNAQELDLNSEKLPAKYYKKNGSLDMRYSICREYAAKRAESQNAVKLEAPYTPIEPERPSDDYGGGGKHRKKPRRPLEAERGRKAWLEKCDICSEGPIYEKDVNIEDYDDPIQVCQSCFDDIFTDKAAESFETEGGEEPETITHVIVLNEGESGNSIRKKIRNAFDKVGYQISPVPKKLKGLTYLGSNSNPVETFIYNEHINKFRNALEEQELSPLFTEVFNSYWDIPDEKMKHYNKVGYPAPYSSDIEYINEYHDAESFEAAYTPEQRLDDYTPEQLTTSSAVTGDFFEDSLKYSYGGIQGAEELPQQETEIVYAEGFPALQNAEAGMVVDNIENYYIKKKEKFMTILVDEPTLFRMAHDLPLFVELFPSEYAGYTNIKFNYIENPDMEQKILSYAITLQDTTEENKEESEYRAGDVRSRLFDVEFDDWAEQEMKTHGDEVSFKDWADEESESHGDEEFMDWAKHEEESHGERYEAEGGRNVSDFEMSNTDRYEIGNEIIALSSALKKAGDWDWKTVKKIGKGIKEGKYERIKKNMADIDFKTRRVLWDRHHNDFYDLFTDKQMRGLAIPWVTDKYKAEISDEKLTKLTEKFTTKIPSFTKGLDYTTCVSCGLEVRVEALEDTQGNILYYFYSCKCGHNDIQDSSYDAEYFEARQERKPRKMCVNCNRQSLAPSASRLGQNICRTCQRRFGLKSKQAEFFEAQPVNISDDMIIDYFKK